MVSRCFDKNRKLRAALEGSGLFSSFLLSVLDDGRDGLKCLVIYGNIYYVCLAFLSMENFSSHFDPFFLVEWIHDAWILNTVFFCELFDREC